MDIDKIMRRSRSALSLLDLPLRPADDLDLFADSEIPGERIMLDTCVIIDQMQGKIPDSIEDRILARTTIHSPVVIGELSFLIGNLDPKHPETPKAVESIKVALRSIPEHRIISLTHEDTSRGNILAGSMSRILGHNKENRRKVQNDAILAAHASRIGCLLVTRNKADFDRLSQLDPKLRVAFY